MTKRPRGQQVTVTELHGGTYTFRRFLLLLKYELGTTSSSFSSEPPRDTAKKNNGRYLRLNLTLNNRKGSDFLTTTFNTDIVSQHEAEPSNLLQDH